MLDIGTKRLEHGPSPQSSLMSHGQNTDTKRASGRTGNVEFGLSVEVAALVFYLGTLAMI